MPTGTAINAQSYYETLKKTPKGNTESLDGYVDQGSVLFQDNARLRVNHRTSQQTWLGYFDPVRPDSAAIIRFYT